MIKIANNLNALCAKQAGLLSVPSKEEQALEMLSTRSSPDYSELARNATSRMRRNRAAGVLGGAAAGGLLGLPFAGVGAIPGALGGALVGGVGLPTAMEMAADYETDAGKKLLQEEEVKELLRKVHNAKKRRLLLNLAVGTGLGAAAGFPFAGVGAIPGALAGAVGGGLYNRFTESPTALELLNSEEGVRVKKKLDKALGKSAAENDYNKAYRDANAEARKDYRINDALVGGGLGLGVGGLAGALKEYLSDEEEKSYLKSILLGGGLGGLAGAGLGVGYSNLTGKDRKLENILNAVEANLPDKGLGAEIMGRQNTINSIMEQARKADLGAGPYTGEQFTSDYLR